MRRRPPRSTRTVTLFPYTTLFRSAPGRSLAADADIHRQKLGDAKPDRRAVHGADHGFRAHEQVNPALVLHHADLRDVQFPARVGIDLGPRLESGSGAEDRSRVGQHDRADLFVLVGAFDRQCGLAVEWGTPSVAPPRLVLGDDRDGPTIFVADMFVR